MVIRHEGWHLRYHLLDIITFENFGNSLHAMKMMGQKRLEPPTGDEFRMNLKVWRILCRGGVDRFMDALNGHNST